MKHIFSISGCRMGMCLFLSLSSMTSFASDKKEMFYSSNNYTYGNNSVSNLMDSGKILKSFSISRTFANKEKQYLTLIAGKQYTDADKQGWRIRGINFYYHNDHDTYWKFKLRGKKIRLSFRATF